jgi:hypothetical protein
VRVFRRDVLVGTVADKLVHRPLASPHTIASTARTR